MESCRTDQLGRALTWSLFVHGAIAIFIIIKSLVFPGTPIFITPSLRVDLVGLPDLLKKDLSQVSKALPKPDIQEKAPTPVKPIAPVEVAVKPDEMVLNPKKALTKKADAKEDRTKEKKLQSALARIRALEKLKDKDEDDDSVVIKGNQISQGSSLSGNARENAESGYYDLVREALVEFWSLPPWLARQKLAAQIQIRIDPAGTILSSRFVKSSGNPQFDEAILATLRDAQPLPRPPKALLTSLSDNGIVVGFPL